MNPPRLTRIFTCAVSILAAVVSCRAAEADAFNPVLIKGAPAHPTRLLAKVKPVAHASAHASVLSVNGLRAIRGFELVPGLVVLDVDPQAQSMAAAGATNPAVRAAQLQARIEALRASGLFEYVEPDYLFFADATPDDSAFAAGTLWGLRNTGQAGGTSGVDIDAVRAWDVTTGSTNVIVAVIDTGIRYTHQDLAANMWRNPTEVAGNGIDDDSNGYIDDVFGINAITNTGDPMDDDGHGTHVAGTIGAVANNGQPHVGVAWNVRLMALKFIPPDSGGATSDAIECIQYAVAKGAKILNNSWGHNSRSQALLDAIVSAQIQGVLFVAAAGNDGTDNDTTPHYPANYEPDNVIAVAAIDRSGNRASFSDYGAQSVDLGAPGVAIYSTVSASDSSYSTYQGTSMATPHVSGVAALIRARFPTIALADLRDRLLNTTTATTSLQGITVTGGRVNAYQALTLQGDGQLEVSVSPSAGTTLYHGRPTVVVVRVTDLVGVTGAAVTGTTNGGGALTFFDNGVTPDAAANDSRYTGTFSVPATGTQLTLSVVATAPGKMAAHVDFAFPLQAPPANDHFANRIALTFNNGSTTANNTGATLESGEPVIAGEDGGASLWWTWTAPAGTSVTVSTEGSNFDTLLGVYTGSSVNALTEIASNDDISGPNQPSKVTFSAIAGTVYQIVVDGWEGTTGSIRLNLIAAIPPANDNFADATAIGGASALLSGSTINGTREIGEPNPAGQEIGASVWWTWTAPFTGSASVAAESTSYPGQKVAVYLGSEITSLTRVPGRESYPSGSHPNRVDFLAEAGSAYRIVVFAPSSAAESAFTLSLSLRAGPTNDRFQGRIVLIGTLAVAPGTNDSATPEIGEPRHDPLGLGASVWWTWTAPHDGTATIVATAINRDFFPAVAAYTGSAVSQLVPAGGSNDRLGSSYSSRLRFRATGGTTYQIAVDSSNNGTGAIDLTLTLAEPPSNDLFSQRSVITGASASVSGTTEGATRETAEPVHTGMYDSGTTVWWTWTAPWSGTARIDTLAGGGVLAVYTGGTLAELIAVPNSVASHSDKRVIFHAKAGVSYAIAVDGLVGVSGPVTLNLSLVTGPANDTFADRIRITGTNATATGTTVDATTDAGEPDHNYGYYPLSVWWEWTAPADGRVVLRTDGQFHVTAVYSGSTINSLVPVAATYGFANRVVFTTVAGATYQIAVARPGIVVGDPVIDLQLLLVDPPANDAFAGRISVAGAVATVTGSNLGASAELGEPRHSYNAPIATLWWNWTAPATGRTDIAVLSTTFSVNIGVYTGAAVNALTPVSLATNGPGRWYFEANAGSSYNLAVDGFNGARGEMTLQIEGPHPPIASVLMASAVIVAGSTTTLNVNVVGRGPISYQWMHDGVAIKGANSPVLAITSVQRFSAGNYSVRVSNELGETTSQPVALSVIEPPPSDARLANLSTRALALSGDNVLIPGFVVAGPGNKQLLIRAVGPTLAGFGVSGVLPNPQLTLKRWNGTAYVDVAQNDDWGTNSNAAAIIAKSAELFAFPLNTGSADAALLVDLAPGQYSAVAGDAGTATGIAIVELYDADTTGGPSTGSGQAPASRLINISNRGYVGAGDSIMIPGFVVSSEGPKTLLIRAVGPTLSAFGVSGVLADPTLSIYRRDQTTNTDELILTNDDWSIGPGASRTRDVAAQIQAFALPEGSNDAAFVVTLNPGIYTVHARGANNTTGVALVEVYAVP